MFYVTTMYNLRHTDLHIPATLIYCVDVHIAVLSYDTEYRHSSAYNMLESVGSTDELRIKMNSFIWLDLHRMKNVHRHDEVMMFELDTMIRAKSLFNWIELTSTKYRFWSIPKPPSIAPSILH